MFIWMESPYQGSLASWMLLQLVKDTKVRGQVRDPDLDVVDPHEAVQHDQDGQHRGRRRAVQVEVARTMGGAQATMLPM